MTLSWTDIKSKREKATVRVPVCLSQTIVDQIAVLNGKLIDARMEDRRHEGELDYSPQSEALAREIIDLESAAAEHEVEFVFGEVPRARWNVLMRTHSATKQQRAQGITQFNPDTFPPAAIAASIIDPPLTEEEAEELCAEWSEGQVTRLFNAVLDVNMGDRSLPKGSSLASETIREFGGKSQQPSDVESHPPSSLDE
jgi:hypothetical protein